MDKNIQDLKEMLKWMLFRVRCSAIHARAGATWPGTAHRKVLEKAEKEAKEKRTTSRRVATKACRTAAAKTEVAKEDLDEVEKDSLATVGSATSQDTELSNVDR